MKRTRLVTGLAVAFLAVVVGASGASAAPKTGCQAAEKVSMLSVEDAAATIWAGLLDRTPWVDEEDFLEQAVRPEDRNGDGDVCLGVQGGEDLNPNAHWYRVGVEVIGSPAELFIYTDNHRGAVDR
jgi:hypothetical protein